MSRLMNDLRYCLRGLMARPMFLLVAVLSLGLGIGVNTAIYSLFHQVALRSLPVAQPDELVNLVAPGPKPGSKSSNNAGRSDHIFSYPMLRDLQRVQTPFVGIAAHRYIDANLGFRGDPQVGNAMLVSGNYFSLLQLTPALGRLLGPDDDKAIGASPVAVLSHSYWQNQLGGAADVLDRALTINGQTYTIVGVAPRGFFGTTFGTHPQVFVPITQRWQLEPLAEETPEDRMSYWVYLFARLEPGVSIAQAQEEINGPYQSLIAQLEVPLHGFLDEAQMAAFKARRVQLLPGARGQSTASDNGAAPLALMLGAAVLVLVIACLNIANLMLARGAARSAEIAVRASMGASRGRLLRQLMVESLLLAGLGALASLPLAVLVLRALARLMPNADAEAFDVSLDAATLQFTVLVAFATVLLFGLFPALQLARTEPIAVLRGESGQTGSRASNRFRAVLAIAQVGFSTIALVLAGLFLQSLANLGRVDLGMQVGQVAMFTLSPERNGYSPERAAILFDQVEEELRGLPGVTSVASSMVPVLSNSTWQGNVSLPGMEAYSADQMTSSYNQVGEGFFSAFSIPLLAGRDFTLADAAGTPRVAVINRSFAQKFQLGDNPIGKRMAQGAGGDFDIEIVGLVEDSKYTDIREAVPPQYFLPRRQDARLGSMNFYVRAAGDPAALIAPIRNAVKSIDAQLPIENVHTMREQLDSLLTMDRVVGLLAAAFALLSTALAALGLFGVLSYTLAQRMREIGLRLALGAAPSRLRAMVLGQVARMTVVGSVLGLLVALWLGRAAQSLLFGLQGHDPLALSGAVLTVMLVALGAAAWPARRASRIDPLVALRHD